MVRQIQTTAEVTVVPSLEEPPEIRRGATVLRLAHFARRAARDNAPAFVAGTRPDVDDPVAM